MPAPESCRIAPAFPFPNSRLPLLIYRAELPPDAGAIEGVLGANSWRNGWRNGIFRYHHFHSIAHEVLGIAAGEVTVVFGGPEGRRLVLRAGDAVVIPAGVAHCNLGQSADLLVVGAYPDGADYDICRGDPAAFDAANRAIEAVPRPGLDPLYGRGEGLTQLWR